MSSTYTELTPPPSAMMDTRSPSILEPHPASSMPDTLTLEAFDRMMGHRAPDLRMPVRSVVSLDPSQEERVTASAGLLPKGREDSSSPTLVTMNNQQFRQTYETVEQLGSLLDEIKKDPALIKAVYPKHHQHIAQRLRNHPELLMSYCKLVLVKERGLSLSQQKIQDALAPLLRCYIAQGQIEKAETLICHEIELSPPGSAEHMMLADILDQIRNKHTLPYCHTFLEKGRYFEAYEGFSRLFTLHLNSNHIEPLYAYLDSFRISAEHCGYAAEFEQVMQRLLEHPRHSSSLLHAAVLHSNGALVYVATIKEYIRSKEHPHFLRYCQDLHSVQGKVCLDEKEVSEWFIPLVQLYRAERKPAEAICLLRHELGLQYTHGGFDTIKIQLCDLLFEMDPTFLVTILEYAQKSHEEGDCFTAYKLFQKAFHEGIKQGNIEPLYAHLESFYISADDCNCVRDCNQSIHDLLDHPKHKIERLVAEMQKSKSLKRYLRPLMPPIVAQLNKRPELLKACMEAPIPTSANVSSTAQTAADSAYASEVILPASSTGVDPELYA